MNKKILFIYSKKTQIELPQKLFTEYQVKSVFKDNNTYNIILQFKPQLIMFDEFVSTKYVNFILSNFKFIPICVIGHFEDVKKLENFLKLGVNVINLSQQKELEILSTVESLLWFSLSREELWDGEYELSKKEIFLSRIKFFLELILLIISIFTIFYFTPKLYGVLIKPRQIFYEVDFKYLSPSDIISIGDGYIINDWTIKNLFEYDAKDELLKMYIPEQQLNSISMNEHGYVAGVTMYSNKIYFYKYPNFSVVIGSVSCDNVVLSVNFDQKNHLYILDNKNTLYEYIVTNDFHKLILISSITINEFFPIDVYTEENHIYVLDNTNNLYKLSKSDYKIISKIILSKFFEPNQIKFTSFAINKNWVFFISEKSKKGFKFPKKLVT